MDTYFSGHGTFEEVAKQFSVGEATVNRWVNQLRTTGSLYGNPAVLT